MKDAFLRKSPRVEIMSKFTVSSIKSHKDLNFFKIPTKSPNEQVQVRIIIVTVSSTIEFTPFGQNLVTEGETQAKSSDKCLETYRNDRRITVWGYFSFFNDKK